MPLAAQSDRLSGNPPKPGLFDIFDLHARSGRQPNILGHLNKSDKLKVLKRVKKLTLAPKEILFRQGDLHDGIFLIGSGVVRTFYNSPSGKEITLAYWQPGNFVGGPDVFGESIHMWSGMSVVETEVIKISGKNLRALMTKIPELGIGIAEALVFKGKCFSSLVQMLGTRSVSERLCQLLLMLVEVYGQPNGNGGYAIAPQFTHEDLAHMVGASRQWVTMSLDVLQKRGVIKIRKKQVIVLNPTFLCQ